MPDVLSAPSAAPPASPGSVVSGPRRDDDIPAASRTARQAAWDEFGSLPSPSKGDEPWRFANLKHVDLADYIHAPELESKAAERAVAESSELENVAARFVFGNDVLLAEPVISDDLRDRGVICLPLLEAMRDHPELVEEHFMTSPIELGSAKFAALHKASVRSGVFVYVPRGTEIALPIEIHHWVGGSRSAVFPHTLVVAEANAKVAVADFFHSADEGEAFSCGVCDLAARDGANVTYVSVERWNRATRGVQLSTAEAGRDARIKSLMVNLGAKWIRTESSSRLLAQGADSQMLSVSVPDADQEVDQRTLQHHMAPRTTSDLLYKNALYENSRTIFAGLIRVDDEAHFTDAFQTCRNLLMSEACEATAMPGLEINADQVKCSHGATSGPIPDEDLFYLRSRGIPELAARQLITFGFLKEVIDRIDSDPLRDAVLAMVEDKFRKLGQAAASPRG